MTKHTRESIHTFTHTHDHYEPAFEEAFILAQYQRIPDFLDPGSPAPRNELVSRREMWWLSFVVLSVAL